MAWVHLIARKFAVVLRDPEFLADNGEPYVNDDGVPGWRYRGLLDGRDFYISKSSTLSPPSPEIVAKILSDDSNIDERKFPLYFNKHLGDGIRVEAWYLGHWFQVFTPNCRADLSDYFSNVVEGILANPNPTGR